MNIISTVVGITIMGAAAPSVMQMSLAPLQAQKRAQNFAEVEAVVVTYAAEAEANQSLPNIPDNYSCSVSEPENSVYKISCLTGNGEYDMKATRAFRILPEIDDGGSGGRNYQFPSPINFSGHECHTWQEWGTGTNAYNQSTQTWVGKSCVPPEIRSRTAYLASNPDSWLYDINNHNGWGDHPNY